MEVSIHVSHLRVRVPAYTRASGLPQSLCADIFAVLRRHAAIIYTNMSPVLALPSFSRKGCEARRPVPCAVVMHAARSSR